MRPFSSILQVKASVLILPPDGPWSGSLTAAIESYGYRVLVAPTPGLALGALRHIRFDVLVGPSANRTISGVELGKQARLIQPDLRLVGIAAPDGSPEQAPYFDALVTSPLTPSSLHKTLSAMCHPDTSQFLPESR